MGTTRRPKRKATEYAVSWAWRDAPTVFFEEHIQALDARQAVSETVRSILSEYEGTTKDLIVRYAIPTEVFEV